MVNIEKLNSSIEKLDIQSKEIEGVIEKQKKFDDLLIEIEKLKKGIEKDSNEMLVISKEIDNLMNKSEHTALNVEGLIDKKLIEIIDIVNGYNKGINSLSKEVNDINENSRNLNTSTLKKLNEFVNENYKAVNEFQNTLEVKNDLLKSGISLEITNLEKELQRKNELIKSELLLEITNINKSINDLGKETKEMQKEIDERIITSNEAVKTELNAKIKGQQIFSVVIIILLAINVFLSLGK